MLEKAGLKQYVKSNDANFDTESARCLVAVSVLIKKLNSSRLDQRNTNFI